VRGEGKGGVSTQTAGGAGARPAPCTTTRQTRAPPALSGERRQQFPAVNYLNASKPGAATIDHSVTAITAAHFPCNGTLPADLSRWVADLSRWVGVRRMERFLRRENIKRYRRLLREAKDEAGRRLIQKLLSEEEQKEVTSLSPTVCSTAPTRRRSAFL